MDGNTPLCEVLVGDGYCSIVVDVAILNTAVVGDGYCSVIVDVAILDAALGEVLVAVVGNCFVGVGIVEVVAMTTSLVVQLPVSFRDKLMTPYDAPQKAT